MLFGTGKPYTKDIKNRLATLPWLREGDKFITYEGFQFMMLLQVMCRIGLK